MAVITAYSLLTLAMTYPLVTRLGTHLLASTNDHWIYPWNNWWVKQAITQGYEIYRTPYLFYPLGAKLTWHGFSWFSSLLWLPLQLVLGSLAAHNVIILLTFVIAGYTAYLLAYEVTGSHAAAFVAGLVYAFYPHRYAHRGQLKLLSNQWIPLAALYLVRLTRRGRLRDGLGFGMALALCGLCGWHQLFLGGLWGTLWLLHSLVVERERWDWTMARNLLVGGLVCLVVLSPLLLPMVRELVRTPQFDLQPSPSGGEKRTDLLAFFLPSADHPILEVRAIARLYDEHIRFGGPTATVGWVALLLAGCGICLRRKVARPWSLSAVVLAVLALGSNLQINGHSLPISLPYALVQPTLLGTFMRHPNRFNIALALPISVIVGLGWQGARVRWAALRRRRPWTTVSVSLLILVEYCPVPVPVVQEPASPFYEQLREEEGTFAVADFPIDLNKDKYTMYVQTLHERPMVGGHVSRPPSRPHAFVEEVPILTAGRDGPPQPGELDDISRQLAPLATAGIRYVMIHKDRADEAETRAWRRWFASGPAYEDDRIIAYRTDPAFGRDFEFTGSLEDGLGIVAGDVEPDRARAGKTLHVALTWGTRREPRKDWTAEITLLSEQGEVVDRASFEPFAEWPTFNWGRNALARRDVTLRLSPSIPGGAYRVALALVGGSATAIIIDEIDIQGTEDVLQSLETDRRMAVPFGEELLFLGYALDQKEQTLNVTWHWQALHDTDVSYKLFLHLYDADSGALVSQLDVMPHDCTYPTDIWLPGEIVSDQLRLPLEGVSPGRYQLTVGVYHPKTGERLPIGSRTSPERHDALILQEVTVP